MDKAGRCQVLDVWVWPLLLKYKYTLFYLLLMCFTVIMANSYSYSTLLIVNVIFVFFVINLLSKLKPGISLILNLILAIVIGFNAYFAFAYNIFITMGSIGSIFETNLSESLSMIRSQFLLGSFVFVSVFFLHFKSRKELRNSRLTIKMSLISIAFYGLIFVPVNFYFGLTDYQRLAFYHHPLNIAQERINGYAPILYGNTVISLSYYAEINKLKAFSKMEKTLPKGISLSKNFPEKPKKIFLILGESSTRDYYSLYNYPYKTTPFLDSLRNNTHLLSYYDGIAPSTLTRLAVPLILTFASPIDNEPFYTQKTIVDMANMAGYETVWISNAPKLGLWDSHIGCIANSSSSTFFNALGQLNIDDFDLLSPLRNYYKEDKYQFFIIHLQGSHADYRDKYDKTDENDLPEADHYDRSIHHTDRFLREVYNIACRDSSSLMYYVSDHGEIVGKGHGMWFGGTGQYHVPLVVINNNCLSTDLIVEPYIDTESSYINTSSSIYILAEYMGYEVSEDIVNNSIVEGKYVRQALDNSKWLFSDITEKLN